MDFCKPAFVTAALFVAILILDLAKRDYRLLGGHFLFGIISVLLMLFLCQNDAEFVAWGVLLLPFLLLALGLVIGAIQKTSGEPRGVTTNAKPIIGPSIPECTCDETGPYSAICHQHPIDASGCVIPKETNVEEKKEEKPLTKETEAKSEKPVCGQTTGLACLNPSVLQSA
jgi:hypothetical protein